MATKIIKNYNSLFNFIDRKYFILISSKHKMLTKTLKSNPIVMSPENGAVTGKIYDFCMSVHF